MGEGEEGQGRRGKRGKGGGGDSRGGVASVLAVHPVGSGHLQAFFEPATLQLGLSAVPKQNGSEYRLTISLHSFRVFSDRTCRSVTVQCGSAKCRKGHFKKGMA